MRILIVEDDLRVASVLRDCLRDLRHEVQIVTTAEAALDWLKTQPQDLVLLDLHLPGMSGYEFLQLQASYGLRVPIVAMSGVGGEAEARRCLKLGAVDFVGKPIALQRLTQVIACVEAPPAVEPPSLPRPVERRRAMRVPVELPVRVREYTGVEWDATSLNLSTSGIKVRSELEISPGAAARIAIALPDGEPNLDIVSVLVRADMNGYAFHFANMSEWQFNRLSTLVQRSAAQQGQVVPHLRILRTIAQSMADSLDVDETVRVALDALTDVTGHEIASLHLLAGDGQTLHLHGDRGLMPRLREINRTLTVGEGLIGRVVATGRSLHIPDVTTSPDLLPAARAIVTEEGMRGFVCVPVRSAGRVLGALSLGRRVPEPFSEAEIAMLEATADQIGHSLEYARLASETRRQLDDVKQAQAHLAAGERLSTVGRLAAGVVHEINNPLSIILAQAQLLLRADTSPDGRERLRAIIEETSRAARLLQSLLQLSRQNRPERNPCLLTEQVRWVVDLNRPQLEKDGINVVCELDSVPPVWADENQIRQVLLNLIRNAHQAMAGHDGVDRVLTLRLSHERRCARLDVLDSGPGIPPQVLPRLFQAFFTTKAPGEGTGLGLWVSASIIEQHGGRLRAENRREGGAAFVIEMPLAREDAGAPTGK
ncbi:MAG TPA: response regulator [Methylomirabilota bacterium]|jgi:signal transduction histidine kinase/ActR/RegA family two-component response regulator